MAPRVDGRYRLLNAGGAGLCVFALAFAHFWLERYLGLEPCPLCVIDRYIIGAAAVVFAVAAVHDPAGAVGRRIYAGINALVLLSGVAVGVRHVWLQQLPEDQVPACGPSLDYMFDVFPFVEALSMVLEGSGSCAEIDAAFLGVTLAQWTLAVFIALALLALWLLLRPGAGRPRG